jgi:sterol desaturase/sphingolipid hydroxylase (fatty acid hydroxylase superfamily)
MPIPAQAVHFVIHLFLFELVFDLCHYWVHRLCHEVKWLYRHTHKLHHKLIHPTPLGTYMQVYLNRLGSFFFFLYSRLHWVLCCYDLFCFLFVDLKEFRQE